MDEYIKKADVLERFSRNSITKAVTFADGVSIYDTIKNFPTADVAEVKRGYWREETKFIITDNPDDDGYWASVYICSNCGREESRKEPYCHCGAKMDGRS